MAKIKRTKIPKPLDLKDEVINSAAVVTKDYDYYLHWELTHNRKKAFAEAYVINFDAAAAAMSAGYSDPDAPGDFYLSENLLKRCRLEIDAALANKIQRNRETADRVIAEVSAIAFADTEILTSIKTRDKLEALKLLAKHLGLFEADNKQKAAINQNIQVNWL